jgi:predicted PolB exonuclease-like 3'-5' exonuclease
MDDFPPPQAHRVVSLAWVDLITDDPKSRYYHYGEHRVLGGWDCPEIEREILRAFGDAQRSDRATIVSWNGRTFDLPVINLRSLHHKLRMDWYYQTDGVRYRYSEEGHCDLMDVFSDYGAARAMKLGDVARTMGLPGKHGEVAGHNVALTVASGNNEALVKSVNDYCLSDTIQTALLYVRSRFHKGITNAREYNSAVLSFSDCCSKALPALDLKTLLIAEEP